MKAIFSLLFACLAIINPLFSEIKVLAFSGSTREGSFNKKLVKEAAEMARKLGATVTLIDLKDYPMPFYDSDLEAKEGLPQNAKRLRELMINSDAIIISSPEYNGSISGVLKNAIDWASRSDDGSSSRDAFKGKKFAIMSASPGGGGGARALAHLRSIIENIGGEVIQQQVTIANSHNAFNLQGNLVNASSKQELNRQLQQLPSKIASTETPKGTKR